MDLDKFNPTVADLTALVEKTKSITATDLKDKGQLTLVRQHRIELKKARVTIEKAGKVYREEAVAFQKKVIAKEKELIAIIEPEEARLIAIEDEAEKAREREELEGEWPLRLERLNLIIKGGWDKESLVYLSNAEFEVFFNATVAEKNEKDRRALEAEKARVAEEAAKVERERLAQEREKRVREEERAKAELDAKIAADRAEQDKIDAIARAEREKVEAVERSKREEQEKQATIQQAIEDEAREKKEAEDRAAKEKAHAEEVARLEQEERESKKKYQTFLEKNGWTEETKNDFIIQWVGQVCTLYKKVGSLKVK